MVKLSGTEFARQSGCDPKNNDCNTADTCLDRRLRHAVFFFADKLAIVAPTTSARYAFGYIGRFA
jgi:hypothetical protein